MFHQVAIAYLMQKTPYVFPIVGGRKVEHLLANTEALEISLTNDHIKYLESVVPLEPEFPQWVIVSCLFFFFFCSFFPWSFHDFLNCVSSQGNGLQNPGMVNASATVIKGPLLQPLRP